MSKQNRILLIDLGSDRPEFNEPIGIGRLASVIGRDAPHWTVDTHWSMVDGDVDLDSDLSRYDIVGISAQIGALQRLESLLDAVDKLRDTIAVVGNILATYASDAILERWPSALCVRSEGESAILQICLEVEQARNAGREADFSYVSNLSFVKGGMRKSNPIGYVPLETLPLTDRKYASRVVEFGGISRVEGSRGCHWGRCDFCSVSSRFGMEIWRAFPIDHILMELETLSSLGVRHPYFTDEDFFGKQYGRSADLAMAIISAKREGLIAESMTFFVSVLASDFRSKECLKALEIWKDAGLREVFVGVEAGSNVELRRFSKKATAETNRSAIEILRALNIQFDIGFIFFEPFSTFDDLQKNLTFLRALPLSECDSRVVKRLRIQPLTGSPMTYMTQITDALDLNSLTYPYKFLDAQVDEAWQRFSDWDTPLRLRVDRVLASTRGEGATVEGRIFMKQAMAKIRDCDLDAVEIILDSVKHGTEWIENVRGVAEVKEALLVVAETFAKGAVVPADSPIRPGSEA